MTNHAAKLLSITIKAKVEGEPGHRTLTLEGDDLKRYIGLAWGFTQEGAFLFADHYQAKAIANPERKEEFERKAKDLQAKWANTPAVEIKEPSCNSLSWP